ncbi:UNVERIFIED_CONTAM: hypothetical protein Sradi_6840300 [Sesamum radiatum]|uniref:Uncharacterized protein n=1 Tax=Sesamum radiatum TaxID=300843 RepID=A0AAW2JLM6_SESRA
MSMSLVAEVLRLTLPWRISGSALLMLAWCIPLSRAAHLHGIIAARVRSLWRRLDRALVNPTWFTQWPQTTYFCGLPRTSDHSPIILRASDRRAGRDDLLLQLVQCCRITYCKAVQVEAAMFRQRAKLKWVQDGDHAQRCFSARLILAGRGKGFIKFCPPTEPQQQSRTRWRPSSLIFFRLCWEVHGRGGP